MNESFWHGVWRDLGFALELDGDGCPWSPAPLAVAEVGGEA